MLHPFSHINGEVFAYPVQILQRNSHGKNIFLAEFTIVEYIDPTWVKYMWWIYFIGLVWTSEFIMGCQSMVIAGAAAHWFYR